MLFKVAAGNADDKVISIEFQPAGKLPVLYKWSPFAKRKINKLGSGAPQTVGAVPLAYDFSTAANKAFDDNMIDLGGGVFGFYSGDVNQDEVIDGSDSPYLDLDIFNSEFGVKITDLNGDGSVDGSDATYLENNSFNSVFAHYPQ